MTFFKSSYDTYNEASYCYDSIPQSVRDDVAHIQGKEMDFKREVRSNFNSLAGE